MKHKNIIVDISLQGVDESLEHEYIKTLIGETLHAVNIQSAHIAVVYVSSEVMKQANGLYRYVYEDTDVLSFLYDSGMFAEEEGNIAGEILISPSGLEKYHMDDWGEQRCIVHGVLHICGMVHPEAQESAMYELQEKILHNILKREKEWA